MSSNHLSLSEWSSAWCVPTQVHPTTDDEATTAVCTCLCFPFKAVSLIFILPFVICDEIKILPDIVVER
jgi:hypothetical protein